MRIHKVDERFGRYHFNYTFEADASCELVQVFDDGEKTFIQILDDTQLKKRKTSVVDGLTGASLSTSTLGHYIVAEGTSEVLYIDFNSQKKTDRCKKASIFLVHSRS